MVKYKYESAHDWLNQKIQRINDIKVLKDMLVSIITELDGDIIQDIFQKEMDRDGYFEPIDE